MDTRSLNRIVTIQSPGTGQDDAGQPTDPWVLVAKIWANVRFLSGTETLKSAQPVSLARASVRIRRRPGITAGMRLLFGDTDLQIVAVLPDEVNRDHDDLICETWDGEEATP